MGLINILNGDHDKIIKLEDGRCLIERRSSLCNDNSLLDVSVIIPDPILAEFKKEAQGIRISIRAKDDHIEYEHFVLIPIFVGMIRREGPLKIITFSSFTAGPGIAHEAFLRKLVVTCEEENQWWDIGLMEKFVLVVSFIDGDRES